MLRPVALVRTDVSEELSASFIRVTRIGELRITLAVTSNRRILRRNTERNLKSYRKCLSIYTDLVLISYVIGEFCCLASFFFRTDAARSRQACRTFFAICLLFVLDFNEICDVRTNSNKGYAIYFMKSEFRGFKAFVRWAHAQKALVEMFSAIICNSSFAKCHNPSETNRESINESHLL
jgi:hypothetical protein